MTGAFMRVLAIQNYPASGLGQVEAALREAGAEIDLVMAHEGEAFPTTPDSHDALVVLGGAQNARSDADNPWLPQLCGLMRGFGDSGRSVLGICLGSQLLARAYDGENIIGGAREFGWQDVELTGEGTVDPLFASIPPMFPSFQWHDDTFTLPSGAVRLARSEVASNQAFRVGRAAYGIQFHFEADRPLVDNWVTSNAAVVAERRPDWSEIYPLLREREGAQADRIGLEIARAWVATIQLGATQ